MLISESRDAIMMTNGISNQNKCFYFKIFCCRSLRQASGNGNIKGPVLLLARKNAHVIFGPIPKRIINKKYFTIKWLFK